jgi:hypothetical protein
MAMTAPFSGLCAMALAVALVAGCGGSDSTPPEAVRSGAVNDPPVPGATPFIASMPIHGEGLDTLAAVNVTIAPQPGSASRPVSVTYSIGYLSRHGDVQPGGAGITVPIIGLYAGATNQVSTELRFADGSSRSFSASVETPAWSDGVYDVPTVLQARAPGSALGFDFFYLKSSLGSPVIVDTDGHVRWVGANVPGSTAVNFVDGGFLIGSVSSPTVTRLELDGSADAPVSLDTTNVIEFHHDLENGKAWQLNSVVSLLAGVTQFETVQEFTPEGHVTAQWNLDQIFTDYMSANGDDPTLFVRPGVDWLHINTQIYDPRDDSLIVSSRENFVVKLGYSDGDIRWIFGDTSKYWYTFPSLRAKSLTLVGDGLVPIGQHSITIAPDGNLMLFNNGLPSLNQPEGEPAGAARSYSAVSSYVIDPAAMTATQAWAFEYGETLYSPICSSARATQDGSVLVDFATAENLTAAHIVGLDPSHRVVFDLRYPTSGCDTAWNSQPIALESLQLD